MLLSALWFVLIASRRHFHWQLGLEVGADIVIIVVLMYASGGISSGLGLLLLCIAKVFFYDLRNLETFYRILSFIGLGLILLAVSWVHTRFQEQVRKLL